MSVRERGEGWWGSEGEKGYECGVADVICATCMRAWAQGSAMQCAEYGLVSWCILLGDTVLQID